MKRSSLFAFALLSAFGTARASPVCTTGPVDVAASTVISCGGLTFSDFGVVSAAPGTNPAVTFVGASSANGDVTVNFNPGLSDNTGPQDLWFYFAVSGVPVDSVQLTVAGSGAAVDEIVCGNPIARSGPQANVCAGSPLANVVAFSPPAQSSATATFAPTKTIYVYKDVGGAQAGELSSLSQVYHTSGESNVPEPVTAALIGVGVFVLAWIGRRVRS